MRDAPSRGPVRPTQVYVDLAGWHLYARDMSASPTMKMSQALALQLGPKVHACLPGPGAQGSLHRSIRPDCAPDLLFSLHACRPNVSGCVSRTSRQI